MDPTTVAVADGRGNRVEHAFLGQRLATVGGTSDATVRVIEENRRILDDALTAAIATIKKHTSEIERLVEAVLEHESLDRDELVRLLATPGAGAQGAQGATTSG